MKNYKVFGNENTNLKLTDKAFKVYSDTDPLEIREFEKDGEFTYELKGCIEGTYTAEEVNELLEEMDEAEPMLMYYKSNEEGEKQITYSEALKIMLGTYKDCDMTRDMLTIPNRIDCQFSTIEIKREDGLVLMSGLSNMTPEEIEYDEEGNRI